VSTDDQNLHLQLDALNLAGCEKIFEDRFSGAKSERPGLQNILDYARSGDTIVVWRLDRFSRSLKDLIDIVTLLGSKEIGLKSLQEAIDTSSSSGKLIFHLFISSGLWQNLSETLSEKELRRASKRLVLEVGTEGDPKP